MYTIYIRREVSLKVQQHPIKQKIDPKMQQNRTESAKIIQPAVWEREHPAQTPMFMFVVVKEKEYSVMAEVLVRSRPILEAQQTVKVVLRGLVQGPPSLPTQIP